MRIQQIALFFAFLAFAAGFDVSSAEYILADNEIYRLWLSYPPEKILKYDVPDTKERLNRIRMSAARGEYESLILVLRPQGLRPLHDVRLDYRHTLMPRGGSEAPGPDLQVRRVGYVHVDMPSGVSEFLSVGGRYKDNAIPFGHIGRTGRFPERLVPEAVSVAAPGSNTQFWLTLHVPLEALPGLYRGIIRLKLRESGPLEIPLEIKVFSFALPARPSLKNTSCWSPQWMGREWNKQELKAIYREMSLYRQAPDPILPQPVLNVREDGTVEIKTAEYDAMVSYCLDELGMRSFFFPLVGGAWYTNVYFLWHTPALLKQRWFGIQIFTKDLELTDDFKKTFGDYLRKMRDHFREKGWLDKVYMTTMDEPHTASDLKAVKAFGRFVKSIAPEVHVSCTTYPRKELFGAVDAWCPQQYDREVVISRQVMGEELMFYKNWINLIDMPMVNPRLHGWIAFKTGAIGWLTYATMGRWNHAWDEPYVIYPRTGIKAWGLGLMWYPGLYERRIIYSVRWEMMREGAEDYEYLALLARMLKRFPQGTKAPRAATRARHFLETAPGKVILYPGVLPAGPDSRWETRANFVTRHHILFALRNEAAMWIEKLGSLK